jgi:pimeloyl-ACP methyl ester carboxylesterase
MNAAPRVAFFPGSSGSGAFWQPVAQRLPAGWTSTLWSWPGAGDQPSRPNVSSYSDLIELAAASTEHGSDIVAQSMGGAVAIGLALAHREKVRRLVLVATSGGLNLEQDATEDWRAEYRATFPNADPWVSGERPDFTADIPKITAPTLLISGDQDPISPVSVGQRLHGLLPDSCLRVLPGGTHWLAHDRPDQVARLVIDHLGAPARPRLP